ncbi:MAG: TatD family hydrolase, partial [Dehalococcoidia bacterium]|nr:TatD family hydrolase [Dehalococcoidia bacterium]
MKLIDTHAHLDMDPFDRDRNGAITRALQAGVSTIVTVGIDLPSSEKAIKLAESHPEIWATVGFHPHE